jgi:predicted Zn-dependent protease with MMP-like domain
MDLNRMGEILDMLAEELPEEFYRDLNAGIVLTPEIKKSPYGDDLTIMGEYVRSNLGRGINIYGGSINSVYGWMSEEQLRDKLREIVRHEFRHHMENLAGMYGADSLEHEDMEEIKDMIYAKMETGRGNKG